MRVGLVLLAILASGCTINFVKKPAEPEIVKQQVEYFKWLYEKGFYRSDPEIMRSAASKLLGVGAREREQQPAQIDLLERVLRRLEEEIDRLAKERR